MRWKLLAAILCVGSALAQPARPPLAWANSNPNGTSCGANSPALVYSGGTTTATVYVCTGGTYAAISATGSSGATWASGTFSSTNSVSITHNLNTTNPAVMLYDSSGYLLGSTGSAANVTAIQATSSSVVVVTLSASISGTWAVVGAPASSPTLSAPTFSQGSGTYNNTLSVTISASAGARICYTTDGSTPAAATAGTCSHGSTYSSAVSISATATQLQALATESGSVNSTVTSATYTLQVATPTSSPSLPTTVASCSGCLTFSDSTSGAAIYYNTTGSPTCSSTLYTGALSPGSTTTYYWVACLSNFVTSSVASGTITISSTLSNPTFSPPAGTYSSTQTVTITYPGGATGCWATSSLSQGGTAGTCGAGWTTYSGTISVSSTETLYAYATEVGFTNSSTVSAAYTINSGIGTITAANHNAVSATTNNVTITASAGDVLWVLVGETGSGSGCPAVNTPTDGASDTFTIIGTASNQNFDCLVHYYAKNVAGGSTTVTVTVASSVTYSIMVFDIPGANASAPLVSHNAAVTSATPYSLTGLTSSSGNVMLCAGSNFYATTGFTAGNPTGMAIPTNGSYLSGSNGNPSSLAGEYFVVSSSQTSCTMAVSASNWYGSIVGVVFTP